ncbi:MAG: S-layer homology domain-containing protein [Coriobacteriia bacterium]|nr:S-layer homology domain-containing protein [Coriobacteriia bacterium]
MSGTSNKLKRLAAFVCAALLAVALMPLAAFADTEMQADMQAQSFPDVQPYDDGKKPWYYDSVYRAANLGLFSGYKNGNFGPNDTLTRAQAAVVLWRYLAPEDAASFSTKTAKDTTGMADLAQVDYYTGAANWAVANGIINGKEQADGTRLFDPNAWLTREQLCAIMRNAAMKMYDRQCPGSADRLNSVADSGNVSSWARMSVAWGLTNGVISGKQIGDARFAAPGDVTMRAEMAAIMLNCIDKNILAADASAENVHYVAVLGVDTWHKYTANTFYHMESADLIMLTRVDCNTGTISLVSVLRDAEVSYADTGDPRFNYRFHKGFYDCYYAGGTYAASIAAGSKRVCSELSSLFGVTVDNYAAVDLETYMNIVDAIDTVAVNVPFTIDGYKFYTQTQAERGTFEKKEFTKDMLYPGEDQLVTIQYGVQVLNGWHAMVAARARTPYEKVGPFPLWQEDYDKVAVNGVLDQDNARQFLNRRTLKSLIDKGLSLNNSNLVSGFVNTGLLFTNISNSDLQKWYSQLASKKGNIRVYGATVNCLQRHVVPNQYGENKYVCITEPDKYMEAGYQLSIGSNLSGSYAHEQESWTI